MGMKTEVIKALSAPTLQWKTIPGDPYINDDTIFTVHGATIFIYCTTTLTLHLPKITSASAGSKIEVVNLLTAEDSPGDVNFVTDDADVVEIYGSAIFDTIFPSSLSNKAHFWLMSNGVDRWSFYYPDSGGSVLESTVP